MFYVINICGVKLLNYISPYTTVSLLEVLVVFLAKCFVNIVNLFRQ